MASPPRPLRSGAGQSTSAARAHLTALRSPPGVPERFNVPSRPVLREVGLALEDCEDPERSATFADVDRLLIGEAVGLESFGIAGRLARNSPSVGKALQDLATDFVLHDSGGTPNVAVRDGIACLAYGIHATGMRQLCGADWQPDTILLPRSRPSDMHPYRDSLQAPLRFDAMQAALLFPERWLEQPIAGADSLLHKPLADRAASGYIPARSCADCTTPTLRCADRGIARLSRPVGLHRCLPALDRAHATRIPGSHRRLAVTTAIV